MDKLREVLGSERFGSHFGRKDSGIVDREQIDLIMEAVDEAVAELRSEHDRRVTELLEANNREVERRRELEREVELLQRENEKLLDEFQRITVGPPR